MRSGGRRAARRNSSSNLTRDNNNGHRMGVACRLQNTTGTGTGYCTVYSAQRSNSNVRRDNNNGAASQGSGLRVRGFLARHTCHTSAALPYLRLGHGYLTSHSLRTWFRPGSDLVHWLATALPALRRRVCSMVQHVRRRLARGPGLLLWVSLGSGHAASGVLFCPSRVHYCRAGMPGSSEDDNQPKLSTKPGDDRRTFYAQNAQFWRAAVAAGAVVSRGSGAGTPLIAVWPLSDITRLTQTPYGRVQ